MEVNPLAGLHPVDADIVLLCGLMGVSYQDLIAMILSSARQRMANAAANTAFSSGFTV
jgi:D-alanine-D-alanine ligase